MLYSQIVLQQGMPFESKLPTTRPVAVGDMSREEIDVELMKGIESLKNGKAYTVSEVDEELAKEFGI